MNRLGKNASPKKRAGERKQTKTPAPTGKNAIGAGDLETVFTLLPTVSKPELLDEDGTSDRNFRQFLYDFSCLASYLASARAYLAAQLGVSSPQYNIMMIVAQHQGAEGVSVTDVAQYLHVSTAFITGEIQKLRRAGLVEKRPNPVDGRSILLRLTTAGKTAVQEIAPERLFVNDHLFQGLSGKDFRHLSKTIASMIDDFAQTVDMLQTIQHGHAAKLASRK